MPEIEVTPLGAGQDVGRSCILVSIGGKNIMLDCGMHMGYTDERRFPDFSYITDGSLTSHIDCVIISHFHLDHCGALPYMTEIVGYSGAIYMTFPTKAICPILLEDMRKVAVDRKGETNFFTSQMIKDCMKKVTPVNLHEIVTVDKDLKIKAYYAGHVLGAAMFQVCVGDLSFVYTGDYNMTPDRHLGSAWIDKCTPDLLITESTYATTIRDSKRCRERDILKKIHTCVERGGKVLIPVFALGRAQELCILVESYWERTNLNVPVYFSLGLTEKANNYYRMFIMWTNQKIKETFVTRNMFDFKHIRPFDKSYIDAPGPMVVFASPGMLHAGLSLNIFRRWAHDSNNMLIMPGYCVVGTVGHKLVNGQRRIEFENRQVIDVKMDVEYMSFSAHADAKGIFQLINHCQPRNVLLVHGDKEKMVFLKDKIEQELSLPCFSPANGSTCKISVDFVVKADVSLALLKREIRQSAGIFSDANKSISAKRCCLLHGVLVSDDHNRFRILDSSEACKQLNVREHEMSFSCVVRPTQNLSPLETFDNVLLHLQEKVNVNAHRSEYKLSIGDVIVSISNSPNDQQSTNDITVSWTYKDEALGSYVLRCIQGMS